MIRYLLIICVIACAFYSCDSSRVYEDFTDFDAEFWHQDSVISFQFSIEKADQPYHLKTLFRNSQDYPYHNMYYQYTLKDSKDSVLSEELKQIFLFDPKSGQPNGGGVGDTYDNSQIVLENYTFPSAGKYSVAIKQYMRLDSLPSILSVGWRVETVNK